MRYGVVMDGGMPWFTGARWKTINGARRYAHEQLQLRTGYTAEIWLCPNGLAFGKPVEKVTA